MIEWLGVKVTLILFSLPFISGFLAGISIVQDNKKTKFFVLATAALIAVIWLGVGSIEVSQIFEMLASK